jgi:enoyl-CoA hydratase/carnithine racemase
MSEFVICTKTDGVLEIELRRRDKRNALDAAMYAALSAALVDGNADRDVRVVLLRGQEDMFCAGNNLSEFLDADGQGTKPALGLMNAVQALDKPLIAAVGGVAVGLGTTVLYHCDVVYATPQARFAMPFVPLGVCPEFGASMLGPQYGGYARAAEVLLFGEAFDTEKARELGLVSQVVEAEELIAFATARAHKLASLPAGAVAATRKLLRQHGRPASLSGVFRAELEIFDALLQSPESIAAINAFLRGRKAK